MADGLKLACVAMLCSTQLLWICNGALLNETKALRTKLLTGYQRDVRPVVNQSNTVDVAVSFTLFILRDLDEVSGTITLLGMFVLQWEDEGMVWDPSEYDGVESIFVSQSDVWVPELTLLTPADDVQIIGRRQFYKARYYTNGLAYFQSIERIESSCKINVRKYPFDVQYCVVYFTASGYFPGEVRLITEDGGFDMGVYQPHSVWDILNATTFVHNSVVLMFNIELKRKSEFIVINVVLPTTLLCFLNVLVFILVSESGERVSYCITVLLAISVFMTIISDTLPKSSDPVPIISYKLMIDVIISMLITVVTILNLRLHSKEDDKHVPVLLKKVYLTLCCRSCKRKESENVKVRYYADKGLQIGNSKSVSIVQFIQTRPDISGHLRAPLVRDSKPPNESKVTWKHIGGMIDALAFIIFTIAISANSLMFFLFTMD